MSNKKYSRQKSINTLCIAVIIFAMMLSDCSAGMDTNRQSSAHIKASKGATGSNTTSSKKHEIKRAVTVFLVVSLILAGFGLPPLATTVYAQTSGDYEYSMNSDGTVTIEAYTGTETDLIIPGTLDGCLVTGIDGFSHIPTVFMQERFSSVTIPGSVANIDDGVFRDYTGLRQIIVDSSNVHYASVDGVLFSKNPSTLLVYPGGKAGDYIIPDGVTGIADDAFHYCTELTGLTITGSIIGIDGSLFNECTGLAQIIVDSGNPGYSSFDGALFSKDLSKLFKCPAGDTKSFTIPDSVTNIDDNAFTGCMKLAQIVVDNGNINYSSLDGALFNKDQSTLLLYPSGKTEDSYAVPDSVTIIGDYAFYYCTELASVDIPASVISIDEYAFYYCSKLESAYCYGNAPIMGENAFPVAGATRTSGSLTTPWYADPANFLGFTVYYLADHTGFEPLNNPIPETSLFSNSQRI